MCLLRRVFALSGILLLGAGLMHLSAARVIEESAIPYLAFLSKADFDSRFPGELVEDRSTLEPGWYVTYEHESLVYFLVRFFWNLLAATISVSWRRLWPR